MKLDERVAKINSLIKEKGNAIYSGSVPEMLDLETEINDFIKTLGTLPSNQVRDYANLVNIWAIEVKKMIDRLSETKSQLRSEINQAQTQGRANKAYGGNPQG